MSHDCGKDPGDRTGCGCGGRAEDKGNGCECPGCGQNIPEEHPKCGEGSSCPNCGKPAE